MTCTYDKCDHAPCADATIETQLAGSPIPDCPCPNHSKAEPASPSEGQIVARLSESDDESAGCLYYVTSIEGDEAHIRFTHGDGWMEGDEKVAPVSDLVRVHHHDGRGGCIVAAHGEGDGWQ